MSIIWLASYPKSGNTWLRAFLTAWLGRAQGTPDINALLGWPIATDRQEFDERTGLASSDMTRDEIDLHRPAFHAALARNAMPPFFVKTHEAYRLNRGGEPVFTREAASLVVYLVRNPLDVAVSLAHHENRELDDAIAMMARGDFALNARADAIHTGLPEFVGGWSDHVSSWLEQSRLPVHLVRYEDMVADPLRAFAGVVAACGLECDMAAIEAAVEHVRFARLRDREAAGGFAEKQPTAASFFRSGRVGDGQIALSAEQKASVTDRHGEVMRRLGYLGQG